MDICDFGAIFGASEGNSLTFTAKLPWLEEYLIVGIGIGNVYYNCAVNNINGWVQICML